MLRELINHFPDGVLITDEEGYLQEINTVLTEMLGYTKEELVGRHFSALLRGKGDDENTVDCLISCLHKSKTLRTQYTWNKKNGQPLSVEMHSTLLKGGDAIIGILSTIREVKDPILPEAEDKQPTSQWLFVNRLISFFNQTATIGELLDCALECALDTMKIESGAVLLYDEMEEMFILETSKGFSPDVIAHLDERHDTLGREILKGNLSLLTSDNIASLPELEWMRREHLSSCLYVPLKTKKKVYGMAILGHRHQRFFSDYDVSLLRSLGEQLALSMENVLLYKAVMDSEEKYRLLTESAPIGIIAFTPEGNVFQFNGMAEDIFGLSREEAMHTSILQLLPESHPLLIEQLAKSYMSSGIRKTIERPLIDYGRRSDGTQIMLELSYTVWGERVSPLITATIREVR